MLHAAGRRLWELVYDIIFRAVGWLLYAVAVFCVTTGNVVRKAFGR